MWWSCNSNPQGLRVQTTARVRVLQALKQRNDCAIVSFRITGLTCDDYAHDPGVGVPALHQHCCAAVLPVTCAAPRAGYRLLQWRKLGSAKYGAQHAGASMPSTRLKDVPVVLYQPSAIRQLHTAFDHFGVQALPRVLHHTASAEFDKAVSS